jgi:hypothetical protein
VSFEEFQRRWPKAIGRRPDMVTTLNLIIRADVRGSIEAIEKELSKLQHPEVQIKILHKAVGAITAADVMLAHASQAVVIGFNVIPDEAARSLADEKQVEIRRYDIIYKMTDDIRATAGRQAEAGGAGSNWGMPWSNACSRSAASARRRLLRRPRLDDPRLPHPRQPRRPDDRRLRTGIVAAGERTTSRKCRAAWNAASNWPDSTTSSRTMCWRPTRSKKWLVRCSRGNRLRLDRDRTRGAPARRGTSPPPLGKMENR